MGIDVGEWQAAIAAYICPRTPPPGSISQQELLEMMGLKTVSGSFQRYESRLLREGVIAKTYWQDGRSRRAVYTLRKRTSLHPAGLGEARKPAGVRPRRAKAT